METRILDIMVGIWLGCLGDRVNFFCWFFLCECCEFPKTWQFVGFRVDNICGLWFASFLGGLTMLRGTFCGFTDFLHISIYNDII